MKTPKDVIINIRDEIRLARSEGLKETSLDQLELYLDTLEADICDQKHQKDSYEVKMEHWRHILATHFDHASKYTNIITGLGYGAFFAIWTNVKNDISPSISAWAVLAMALSLLVFIVDELISNAQRAYSLKSEADLYLGDAEEFIKRKDEERAAEEQSKIQGLGRWHFVFWWTTILGLISAFLLMFGIVKFALEKPPETNNIGIVE